MLHGIRIDEVRSMIRRINSAEDGVVDMKSVLFEMLLNVMMRMIGGKGYYGENVEDVEEAKRFREIVIETMRIGGASSMGDYLPILRWLKLEKAEQRLKELQEKRKRFIHDLIKDCRSRMGKKDNEEVGVGTKKSLIQVLLGLQETEPEYYKDEIIGSLMLVSFLLNHLHTLIIL